MRTTPGLHTKVDTGMTQPVHHLGHRMRLLPVRKAGSVDHDHRQGQRTGGCDLGICARPSGVLGNNQINAMRLHQRKVVRFGKRPARHQHMVIGKGWWVFGRVNQTQQEKMLWVRRKLSQMHAPHGQHDTPGRLVQGIHGPRYVGHTGPAIPVLRRPRLSGQSNQRHIRLDTGIDRIPAHLRSKRVGRVDHMRDLLGAQILHQPIDAAKAADALGQRLSLRPVDASGKADRPGQARLRSGIGKTRGFGCPGKDQEVGAHV